MSNNNKRTLNKGETVAEIPLDYAARWDSTTSAGITFNTDEATGDISSWVDTTGNYTLDKTRTNFPIWTPGAVAFSAAMGLVEVTTDFDSANMTLFFAASYDGVLGFDYMVVAPNETSIGNEGGTDEKIAFVMDSTGSTITKSTNDLTNTTMVLGVTNTHVGTNDNDKVPYVGTTALTADNTVSDANSSFGQLNVGWYIDDTRAVEGDFHEMLIWARVLTTAEIAAVVGYLSAKWQAGNEDAASPGITSSTERTWISDYVDPQGKSLATYTPINHRVEGFPIDPNAPVRGNKLRDPQSDYPALLPNLQCWYRSDYTGGMTFDSGDAISGGVVSSWVDITGNFTATATQSGDTATDYRKTSVKGGFPSMEGGSAAGTPKSLECTANVLLDNSTGQERLYWSVGTFGNSNMTTSWGGPHANVIFGGTQSAMSIDMVREPAISYVGSTTTGINYTIADAGQVAGDGRIHIFVWRIIDTGTDAAVESWYSGLRLPDRVSSSADGDPRPAIGALSTSNFDAEGAQMLEIGIAGSTTATEQVYTDGQVESLIRYLCNRYDVDYMPPNAPITIGAWSRQTSSNAVTDCCLWYDQSTIGAQDWALHPNVAQYHTTPTDFVLTTGADAASIPGILKTDPTIKTEVWETDEAVDVNMHMESANTYSMAETTDFPADTLGITHFMVSYMDTATTTANGPRVGSAVLQTRFSGVSDTAIQSLASNVSKNWSVVDQWMIVGNSYAYDDDGTGTEGYPGSTDATPGCYWYCNDETMQIHASPAATTFLVFEIWNNWDISTVTGTGKVAEHIVFKHPLTIEECNELRKYVIHKYGNNFTFTNVQAHHVDENTVAHWSLDTNALDDTGNKAAFDTGTYVAGTAIFNPYQFGYHDHGTVGFSYSAQDTDLDTQGAFTWCAAINLTNFSTRRLIVRSGPPSGGATAADNQRFHLRVETTGKLRYQHQQGTKVNETYTSTASVPTGEWIYIGVTRSADGTSGAIIINDTIETFSGLTAPNNGSNARFEMLEDNDAGDFLGDIKTAIFKSVEVSPGELLAMKKQVFPHT